MRRVGSMLIMLGALLLGACIGPRTSVPVVTPIGSEEAAHDESAAASLEAPTGFAAAVRNVPYQLGMMDQIRIVQLNDGQYQEGNRDEEDFLFVFVSEESILGDFDSDGTDEAAALVTETYSEMGSFVFLVVFENLGGTPQFLASIFLDDSPIVTGFSVEEGEIRVEATVHDQDDPICCPSLVTDRRYRLRGENLVLREFSTFTPAGQPRIITISSPADGAEVSGIVQVSGRVSISPFENTLVYRLFDMGGVELSVGPITVDAPDLGAPGTFNKAIDLGKILTNTTIRIEVEDINVADGSIFAMDSVIVQTR